MKFSLALAFLLFVIISPVMATNNSYYVQHENSNLQTVSSIEVPFFHSQNASALTRLDLMGCAGSGYDGSREHSGTFTVKNSSSHTIATGTYTNNFLAFNNPVACPVFQNSQHDVFSFDSYTNTFFGTTTYTMYFSNNFWWYGNTNHVHDKDPVKPALLVGTYVAGNYTFTYTGAGETTDFIPICGFSESVTNQSVVPSSMHITDYSINGSSWSWSVKSNDNPMYQIYYSGQNPPDMYITYPGYYTIRQEVTSNSSRICNQSMQQFFHNNQTAPSLNMTANITPPNYTPIIPTLPTELPTIPAALNRSHARTIIDQSILGNVSADYVAFWDDMTDSLTTFINSVLDILFFPMTYATNQFSLPFQWIEDLANQYAAKSSYLNTTIIGAIYAFPPKLANLITYSLLLDLILIVMHEAGAKK